MHCKNSFLTEPLEVAAFVSLLSVFNAGGRFFLASCSDYIGRRKTYIVFFLIQVVFFVIPGFAARREWALFEAALFVVRTLYGGGFSTIPAFLADIFGADNVGAIHGSVLTAWSGGGGWRARHYHRTFQPRQGFPRARGEPHEHL